MPFGEGILVIWLACCANRSAPPAVPDVGLRTFTVPKPPADLRIDIESAPRPGISHAPALPAARSLVSSTVGVGYVQRADWGAEVLAAGRVAGLDLQLDSLMTFGFEGARFDHGTLALRHPDAGWQAEAGDLFSDLRGPVRGLRVSWRFANRWQPAFAITRPRPTATDQRTLFVYRDRVQAGPVTVDGELASDGSYFARTRLAFGHVDFETSYRRARIPLPLRDFGAHAAVRIWRGVVVSGGVFQSDGSGQRAEWRNVGLHVPIYRGIGLTLERNFSTVGNAIESSSAAMVTVSRRQFSFFHRYQWGHSDFLQPGVASGIDRDQLQTMASYSPGPRLNLALQVATQWSAEGRAQNWLELETTLRLTRGTNLQIATPMPESFDASRLRVRLDQRLPRRFSLLAEYGRPSAYQTMQDAQEQPRFKIMLRKTWDVATPARGGAVRGRVIDYTGRPVAGARVRLGPYTTDTDPDGRYLFPNMPRGTFDLSLDPDLLPADYAWDGRTRPVSVDYSTRMHIDLVVAPLNAIHGRVYQDRNSNGRFDPGEGVMGGVVRLEDRTTATNSDGAYDFYNVMPGPHVIHLEASGLPGLLALKDTGVLTVELRDDRPVTGADFVVIAKSKPVIWKDLK